MKNVPKGNIIETDVSIAKNYLTAIYLDALNRIVSMYLDYAKNQAQKGVVIYMKDWTIKLDAFLQFNEEAILKNNGKVKYDMAHTLAETEFEKFSTSKDKIMNSDFDKLLLGRK